MEAKEKAKELFEKFYHFVDRSDGDNYDPGYSPEIEKANMKGCAIICVDEMIKLMESMKLIFSDREVILKYWIKVREEIELL